MGTAVTQARVNSKAALDPSQAVQELALFNADGTRQTGRDLAFGPVTVTGLIGTAAKVTSAAEPPANSIVPIKFTSGNTADSPTVAFNGGTARAIKLGGTASTGAKCTLAANGVALFWFDGTVLHQMGVYS